MNCAGIDLGKPSIEHFLPRVRQIVAYLCAAWRAAAKRRPSAIVGRHRTLSHCLRRVVSFKSLDSSQVNREAIQYDQMSSEKCRAEQVASDK